MASSSTVTDVLEPLYSKFEDQWNAIRTRNAAICSSAQAVRADVRRASERCNTAARGWQHMQDELLLLTGTTQLMREMTTRTADLFAQLEALEERLTDLTVARAHRRENAWRLKKLQEVEQHEAAKQREVQLLESMLASRNVREQERAQEERRQIFDEQFEAQRQYVLEHGLRNPADELAHVLASQQTREGPQSLAEVVPGKLADEGELDDFYADVEALDEGPDDE